MPWTDIQNKESGKSVRDKLNILGVASGIQQEQLLAVQQEFENVVYKNTKGQALGVASLDANGLVPVSQIPAVPAEIFAVDGGEYESDPSDIVRIQLKRSEVPGAIPAAEDLETHEIAVNIPDHKFFIKNEAGVVVEFNISAREQYCDTIANLRALPAAGYPLGSIVHVQSYGPVFGKGGGKFVLVSEAVTPDDVIYILPTGEEGDLRWRRIVENNTISLYAAGCVCDARGTTGGEDGADPTLLGFGAITEGDTTFTCATLNATAADIGKLITIRRAGASVGINPTTGVEEYRSLNTTIVSINSATSVEVADAALHTITGAVWACGTADNVGIIRARNTNLNISIPAADIGINDTIALSRANQEWRGPGMYKAWFRPLVDRIYGFRPNASGLTLRDFGVRGVWAIDGDVEEPENACITAGQTAPNLLIYRVAAFDSDDAGIRIGKLPGDGIGLNQRVIGCHVNGVSDGAGIENTRGEENDVLFNLIENIYGPRYAIRSLDARKCRINFNRIKNFGLSHNGTATNIMGGIGVYGASIEGEVFDNQIIGNTIVGNDLCGPGIRVADATRIQIQDNRIALGTANENGCIQLSGGTEISPLAYYFRSIIVEANITEGGAYGCHVPNIAASAEMNDVLLNSNKFNNFSVAGVRFANTGDVVNVTCTDNQLTIGSGGSFSINFGNNTKVVCGKNQLLTDRAQSLGITYGGAKFASLEIDDTGLRGTAEIADDTVLSFIPPKTIRSPANSRGGQIRVSMRNSNFEYLNAVFFTVIASPAATLTALHSSGMVAQTGVLAGTTGIDGDFTVSVASDHTHYYENRKGGTRHVAIEVL
jgi:hypothetical protein